MSFCQKTIRFLFYALFILVPLIFLPNTSELFEFNKIILTYIFVVLISTCWICDCIIQKKFIFRRTPLDIPLLVFLGFSILSLVFSIDVHTSIYGYYSRWNGGLLSLFSYSLLYWAFVTHFDSKSSLNAIRYTLYAAIPVALWAVAEHFGIDSKMWVQDVQNRVFSTIGQPNWLAAYIVSLIYLPLSGLLKFQTPNPKSQINPKLLSFKHLDFRNYLDLRILNLVFFVLLFSVLLFTKSRSGLLAFGISSLVFWIMSFNKKTVIPMIIFTLSTLSFLLVFKNPIRDLVFKSTVVEKTVGTVLESGGTESGTIRKIVWTGATRIWTSSIKNLLIGTGPETFAMAYYQYRPIEHNQTSEWELLYNKAHNEFLNQLATTGVLGFISYLSLLFFMSIIFLKSQILNSNNQINSKNKIQNNLDLRILSLGLFCGWLTISVTNFWGFSVVITQILLFLLPAMAISLERESGRAGEYKSTNLSGLQKIGLFVSCSSTLLLFYSIGKYWYADVKLASSQLQTRYFGSTQNPQYLIAAYNEITQSFKLNSHEPNITSEYAMSAAYLAAALKPQNATQAAQLAQQALNISDLTIEASPHHPNFFKSRSRMAILLSEVDPRYLDIAAQSLQQASLISPTDPRIPYNQGLIAKYQNKISDAKAFFQKALDFKPDFQDAIQQLHP